jgi:DNA-binding NarL/FixJ family response regulator
MSRARLLLADDHMLLLDGYRKLLEPEFELVGAVENGRELLDVAPKLKPDVILLDISMPLLNGIDATRRLRKIVPRTKILIVTMHADPDYVAEAFRAGASGYLLKRSAASELVSAIHEVLEGKRYLTPLITGQALDWLRKSEERAGRGGGAASVLSPRQREVLQLVAEGRTAKEIATLLRISVKTVEFHKARIMKGLGMRSVAEMTQYALRRGMVGL